MRVTFELLRRALDTSGDGFALWRVLDPDEPEASELVLDFVNRAGARDRDPEHLVGRRIEDVLGEEAGTVRRHLAQAVRCGGRRSVSLQARAHPQAGVFEMATALVDDDLVLVTWRDASPALAARRQLDDAYEETAAMRSLLQTALDATSDAFAVYAVARGHDREVVGIQLKIINEAGARPLGARPADLLGQDLRTFFPEAVATGLWDAVLDAATTRSIRHHRVDIDDADGHWQGSFDNTIAPADDDTVVITWRDVTDQSRRTRELSALTEEATHEARHDALTGLPNRRHVQELLGRVCERAGPGSRVGIVFVDLDGFKGVNDTFGHAGGDVALAAVAARLRSLVRSDEVVARYGGDEFVIVLTELTPAWTPGPLLARIDDCLADPVDIAGQQVHLTASLGVALSPPLPPDPDLLVGAADREMYVRKRSLRLRLDPWSTGALPLLDSNQQPAG